MDLAAEPLVERLSHGRGYVFAHVSAERGDFLYEAGTEETVLFAGHEENRFNLLVEPSVHERHLQFIIKITHGAKTANDGLGIHILGEIHEQFTLEARNLDLVRFPEFFQEKILALLETEQGRFRRMDGNGHGNLREKPLAPANDVEMPFRRWVEGSRVYRMTFHGNEPHIKRKGPLPCAKCALKLVFWVSRVNLRAVQTLRRGPGGVNFPFRLIICRIPGQMENFLIQPGAVPQTPDGISYGFRTSRTMWLISGIMIFSIPVRQAFPEPGSVMMMVSRQVPAVARVSMAAVPISS